MENIAALKSSPVISDGKRPTVNGAADAALFAAFVVNIDTAKPQDNRPAPRPVLKAENKEENSVSEPVDAPLRKAEKIEEKPLPSHHSDDDANLSTDVEADAPVVEKTVAKAKPVEAKESIVQYNDIPVADDGNEVMINAEAPVVKNAQKINLIEDKPVTVAIIEKADDANTDACLVSVTIPIALVETKPQQQDEQQGENLLAKALMNAVANDAGNTAKPQNAAPEKTAEKPKEMLQNQIAADASTASDLDAALDAALQAIANAEAKINKNSSREARSEVANAKGESLQNVVVGGGQASPLLSGHTPGQNQPALPHSLQAGAPSAASPSSVNTDSGVRPLAILTGQVEGGKGEVRLAKLQPHTAAQVQEQVAIKLRYAAKAGDKSVSIQLRPDDLGRVDIKLDFKEGNQVSAKITTDNQATLDILKRDAIGLERVLADAGMKVDENGLQFSLRDNGSEASKRGFGSLLGANTQDGWNEPADETLAIEVVPATTTATNGRVNIII